MGTASIAGSDCFSAVRRVREELRSAYVQAIDAEHVLNRDHLLMCLNNVALAHKQGYNKMNRLDSELLLVLAGINNFEDAVRSLAPKEGGQAVLLFFSDRREVALQALQAFERHTDARVQELSFINDRPRLSRVAELYGIQWEELGCPSEQELTDALAERCAVFYSKYR